ncbi:hypothetical protein D9M68_669810 [compost metagenome]
MSHAERTVPNCFLDIRRQFQQTQVVGYRTAFFLHAFGHLFLCKGTFFHQSLIAQGYLNGIQVFPLQVFQQRHFQQFLIIRFTDICRYIFKAGHFGRSPPALSRDQLIVAISQFNHRYRLYNIVQFYTF